MDKRILKTKKCLRQALLQLMTEKTLNKITVKEICEMACVGRVTFYIYYNDKQDLLEECFSEFKESMENIFKKYQVSNNAGLKPIQTLHNLLDAIIDVKESVQYRSIAEDPMLINMYYHCVLDNLEMIESQHKNNNKAAYDKKQLNAFFALGFWGFLHTNNNAEPYNARKGAHQLIDDLMSNKAFYNIFA